MPAKHVKKISKKKHLDKFLIKLIFKQFQASGHYFQTLPKPFRFLMVGGFNTLFGFGLFTLLIFLLGHEKYQLALTGQYLLGSLVSFFTQKFFVFKKPSDSMGPNKKWLKEYGKAIITWCIAYMFNSLLLKIFIEILTLPTLISQAISIVIVSILTYQLLYRFAFAPKKL